MKFSGKLFIFFLLTFFVGFIFAQDDTRELSGSLATRVNKTVYPNSTYSYSEEQNLDFGTYIYSSQAKTLTRSIWKFDFPTNLPQGAYVKKVEIKYKGNSDNLNSFKLNYVSLYQLNLSTEQKWNLAESALFLKSLPGSDGTLTTVEVPDLSAIIRNALDLSETKIYLAFKAGTDFMATDLVTLTELSLKITFDIRVNYIFKNNFEAGVLLVNQEQISSGQLLKINKNTSNICQAIEPQSSSNINYVWNDTEAQNYKSNWLLKKFSGEQFDKGNNINISFISDISDNNSTIIANLRKYQNVVLANQMTGTTQTGNMKVNGVSYSAPTASFQVVEQNNINAEATYIYNFGGSLKWRFDHWSDNGLTSTTRSISASQIQLFNAVYKRVPIFTEGQYRNLTFTFPAHGNLRLSWGEHPDPGVTQYQIWKNVYSINGVKVIQAPTLMATVNRGTTSYTTYYQMLPGEDLLVLKFDVKAYYAPDGTVSDDDYESVSVYTPDEQGKKSAENVEEQIIKEYSINNYPNPFNPLTRIDYAVKEAGFVILKVYDVLGNEICVLINESKEKGFYSINFDASNLPSGVYIYTIDVNNFHAVKKMMLTK